MAFSLFGGDKQKGAWLVFSKDSEVLRFDATMSQSHPRGAEVTKHKVEKGADITDHIQPQAKGLSINGVVAYAPIVDALGAIANATLGPDRFRHTKAFDRIEKAIDERELVTVHTGLKIYENMAIRSFTPTREARTGFDLIFTMELEEVRFVTTATTQLPKKAIGIPKPGASKPAAKAQVKKTQQQATPKGNKGQVPKKPAPAPAVARSKSLLFRWFGA